MNSVMTSAGQTLDQQVVAASHVDTHGGKHQLQIVHHLVRALLLQIRASPCCLWSVMLVPDLQGPEWRPAMPCLLIAVCGQPAEWCWFLTFKSLAATQALEGHEPAPLSWLIADINARALHCPASGCWVTRAATQALEGQEQAPLSWLTTDSNEKACIAQRQAAG